MIKQVITTNNIRLEPIYPALSLINFVEMSIFKSLQISNVESYRHFKVILYRDLFRKLSIAKIFNFLKLFIGFRYIPFC